MAHGTTTSYRKGCHCADCKKANAKAQREYNSKKNARSKAYAKLVYNKNKEAIRYNRILREFGLTPEAYQELLAVQDNSCAVCFQLFTATPHIDHDHSCCSGRVSCGKCVRGLLCRRCNLTLGSFNDDPELFWSALKYLRRGVE